MKVIGLTGDPLVDGVLTLNQQGARNMRQLGAMNAVLHHWDRHGYKRPYPMLALPTGFGKGVIIKRLLRRLEHKKILLVVGTKNILLEQSKEVLAAIAEHEVGESDFSVFPDTEGRVVLATWQGLNATLRKRKIDAHFGLVIIDEVHNIGTRMRLESLKEIAPDAVVGLTATAYRSSGAYRWPEEYGFTIVDAMPLPECIMERWLAPLIGVAIDTQVILPADVRYGQNMSMQKVNRALRHHPQLFQEIGREIAERFLPSGMKTVIIVNRIDEEGCVIARQLQKRGFKVGLAVNQGAARRLSDEFQTFGVIERYKKPHGDPDALQVLISPQVIGEGFDAPATECVIWAAPTMSSLRYTQVMGRGTRSCPGKKYCLVVDFVYMIESYGYSYNFAQFFKKEDLQELDGGLMYVGPEEVGTAIQIPSRYTVGAKIVPLTRLQAPAQAPPADGWLTVAAIARIVGVSNARVEVELEKRDYEPEIRSTYGHAWPHYPPEVAEELREYFEAFPQAQGWMTMEGIAKEIGKSAPWVGTQLEPYKEHAKDRRTSIGHIRAHYPPFVVEALRKKAGEVPDANGWMVLDDIATEVDRNPNWVEKRIREMKVEPETRLSKTRRALGHYPPWVVIHLAQLASAAPKADGWLTLERIGNEVGRSPAYCLGLLQEMGAEGEDREAADGNVHYHYSPEWVDRIREKIAEVPEAVGWWTIFQLLKAVGKSDKWVMRVLAEKGIEPENRRAPERRQVWPHYPPHSLAVLQAEKARIDAIPAAGDWLTIGGMAKALGKDARWVNARIGPFADRMQVRMDTAGREFDHYSPEVLEALHKQVVDFPPVGDWLSAPQVADRLGTTPYLVHKICQEELGIEPTKRIRDDGRVYPCYPPTVVQRLRPLL